MKRNKAYLRKLLVDEFLRNAHKNADNVITCLNSREIVEFISFKEK